MKIVFYLMLSSVLIFTSCATKKANSLKRSDEVSSLYDEAMNYIINDESFKESLKKSYSDLKVCKEINFIPSSYTKPISISFFQKEELVEFSYFSKYNELNYLEFEKVKKRYDSMSKEGVDTIKFRENKSESDCKIALTFSKENKNLILIEYKIIDKNVDPRILYNPRKGYYLIEFNNKQEIIQNNYKILNW